MRVRHKFYDWMFGNVIGSIIPGRRVYVQWETGAWAQSGPVGSDIHRLVFRVPAGTAPFTIEQLDTMGSGTNIRV